jgi:hypothetical protein
MFDLTDYEQYRIECTLFVGDYRITLTKYRRKNARPELRRSYRYQLSIDRQSRHGEYFPEKTIHTLTVKALRQRAIPMIIADANMLHGHGNLNMTRVSNKLAEIEAKDPA